LHFITSLREEGGTQQSKYTDHGNKKD
jgi:hypothetical protein